jgi:hypothetical protein
VRPRPAVGALVLTSTLCLLPVPASAATGGAEPASAPSAPSSGTGPATTPARGETTSGRSPSAAAVKGGVDVGHREPARYVAERRRAQRQAARPVLEAFSASSVVVAGRQGPRFSFRIRDRQSWVTARIVLERTDGPRGRAVMALGRQPTGRRVAVRWRGRALAPGRYLVRIHAADPQGHHLRPSARASTRQRLLVRPAPPPPAAAPRPAPGLAPAPVPGRTVDGRFPVPGSSWSFGGDGSRFGAPRSGRVHQGQDIAAPEGTPIVAPRNGSVTWRRYQAAGAGYYLVIQGDDGRAYVFMHLRANSMTVGEGQRVAAGQRIAEVGNTGSSSGAHLHFEIWVGGWHTPGAAPIDPRPDLERWARG